MPIKKRRWATYLSLIHIYRHAGNGRGGDSQLREIGRQIACIVTSAKFQDRNALTAAIQASREIIELRHLQGGVVGRGCGIRRPGSLGRDEVRTGHAAIVQTKDSLHDRNQFRRQVDSPNTSAIIAVRMLILHQLDVKRGAEGLDGAGENDVCLLYTSRCV